VTGKRLFWVSIIIVELVLLYGWWRPRQDVFKRSRHRIAAAPPVLPHPEIKKSPAVIASPNPLTVARSHRPARRMSLIVNAGLKSLVPISAKPSLVPPAPLSPLESFWCHISMMDSNCDCKLKSEERAANLVTQ
jgi:hypothetical protein